MTLNNFVLLMTLHPDIQEKAREEVDMVVGHDRFPSFNDKQYMPYLSAVLKEVFRSVHDTHLLAATDRKCHRIISWQPVGPTGVPHCTTKDDVYRGYYIPKGAFVITNIWCVIYQPCLKLYIHLASGLCFIMSKHSQSRTTSIRIDSLLRPVHWGRMSWTQKL
jgi:cytochrome P450